MPKLNSIALFALLVTATGAIGFTAWDTHQTQVAARQTTAQLGTVLVRLNSPTGPITETDKLLLALKSTTVHADLAIAHEDRQLEAYDGYFREMESDVHGLSEGAGRSIAAATDAAHSASATLQTANATIQAAQPLLASLDATAQASTRTLNGLDTRIRDPRLDAIMLHIDTMSASADKMLADAQWKEHELLHPTPAKGAKAAIGGAILWLHKLEPPLF